MKNLNKYQKIQLILLVIIIIELVIFVISIVNASTKYRTKEVSADAETTVSEEEITGQAIEEETEDVIEEIDEVEDDTSWDEEDVEDTEVDTTDERNSEKSNSSTYYLKVNYTANVVTAYTKDSSGNYTVAVKAMVCSTGTATPTSGVYAMSTQYRWHELNGGVYGQYCSRITGHILFHSVPYAKQSPDTLKYTAYDKLGTKASSGCVRLTVEDAMWIYNNCSSGTYVEFYSSTDPGPLGKPTAQKISSNVECRNWDPTDPTEGNPWHSYVETTTTDLSESSQNSESDTTTDATGSTTPNADENTNTNTIGNNTQNTASNTNTEGNTSQNTVSNTNTDGNASQNATSNTNTAENTSQNTTNNTSTNESNTQNTANNINVNTNTTGNTT